MYEVMVFGQRLMVFNFFEQSRLVGFPRRVNTHGARPGVIDPGRFKDDLVEERFHLLVNFFSEMLFGIEDEIKELVNVF